MGKKCFLYLFILLLITVSCSSQSNYITNNNDDDIEDDITEQYNGTEIHSGLKGNFLFYVSNVDSDGDIWLYNLDENNKWQISSVDNKNLQIVSLSPDYRYIIYNKEDKKNAIFNLSEGNEMELGYYNSPEDIFSCFQDVNWVDQNQFYFFASTNGQNSRIFKAQLNNENRWIFSGLDFTFIKPEIATMNIYSLSLSYNKKILAFIAGPSLKQSYLYTFNLETKKIRNFISIKSYTDLIWAENNNIIYFFEGNYIYDINFKGAKELVISDNKEFYRLIYHPEKKFKFFYVTKFNDYFFISLKNMDLMGAGDFLCNTQNMKDISIFRDSNFVYYDNSNNEIYFFNNTTKEIKKILDQASLYQLTP